MTENRSKYQKREVDYSRGMGRTRCKNCVYFQPNANLPAASGCRLVAGNIDPEYWCEKFKMN